MIRRPTFYTAWLQRKIFSASVIMPIGFMLRTAVAPSNVLTSQAVVAGNVSPAMTTPLPAYNVGMYVFLGIPPDMGDITHVYLGIFGEFFRFFLPYQDGAVFEGYRWWVSDRTFTAALSGADVRVEVAVAVVPDPSRGDQFLWDNDKFKWGDDEIVWSE